MTSCLPIIGAAKATTVGCILKLTHQWWHRGRSLISAIALLMLHCLFDVLTRLASLFNRYQQERDSRLRDGRQATWLTGRPRRLVGILSCYGWGPGCSADPYTFRRRPSKPRVSNASDQQPKISGQEAERVKEPEVPQRKPSSNLRVRQTAPKFHPFFALTSG